MAARLHWLDKHAAGDMIGVPQLARKQTRESYLIRSLVIEAVNSSQLEGASTTTPVAKKMIMTGRHPRDRDERMIVNNYRAMQFIREQKGEELTLSVILEMHRILTEGTLDNTDAAGRFRTQDEEFHVVDNRSQETLHVPPPAVEIPDRIDSLIRFANESGSEPFIHPVIRAIALHYYMGFVHPFVDGNGRTARALFYWCMARHDYWLAEFVSISGILKRAFAQYGKAYMRTETDEDDLTFFIDHQLDVFERAISELRRQLHRKTDDYHRTRELIEGSDRLKRLLNARQRMLIQHALEHPGDEYTVREHQRRHAVAYETARKDLFVLSDELNLLERTKIGKTFSFFVPSDLLQRLQRAREAGAGQRR